LSRVFQASAPSGGAVAEENGAEQARPELSPSKEPRGSSRFKGVSRAKHRRKWNVRLSVSGAHKYIGSFENEEDAARAFDEGARKHGMLDRLNFPSERESSEGRADVPLEAVHPAAADMVAVADPPSVSIQPDK
jgi:hypothetical protein